MTMLLTSDTPYYDIKAPVILHWMSSKYMMSLKLFVCEKLPKMLQGSQIGM